MLAPKPRRPTVRNLMDTAAIPGSGVALDSGIPSPRSPLERDPRSPKGWRERDSVGVGLGIVAALERTSSSDEPLARLIVANSSCQSTRIAIPIASKSQTRSHESVASHGAKDPRELTLGKIGFYCASPPRFTGVSVFREADFLTYCHLCRKRLQGKDIYMYRGEKAFCSMECRYQQIVSDECQEKCASEASINISSSPYCNDRLFFTGITAA